MAFRFRLQKVLDYRQRIVDLKSREVGEAARLVAGIRSRMDKVQSDIQCELASDHSGCGAMDIQLMGRRREWIEHLEFQLKKLAADHSAATADLEIRRAELTGVWRDLEILQKLKQRQKETWMIKQLKRENQELDEIGQIRSDRQKREKLTLDQAQLA